MAFADILMVIETFISEFNKSLIFRGANRMNKKKITLMFFNETFGKPRSIAFSKSMFIYSAFALSFSFIIFISGLFYFSNIYFEAVSEAKEIRDWRLDSKSQKAEIHKFIQKVNEIEKEMDRIERINKKLRVMTMVDHSNKAPSQKLGLGGSPGFDLERTDLPLNVNTLKKLTWRMDELRTRAGLQEISFFQIDQFFKDRQSYLLSIPSIWPVKGWVTSGFGYRTSPYRGVREMHEGIDIATNMYSDVISPADGYVIRSGRNKILGVMLEIDHGYGFITRYGHIAKSNVSVGDHVKRGQVIGQSGNTGRSTGPHLHYAVYKNGIPVNPLKYIIE